MTTVTPKGAGKKSAFPIRIFLERPTFYEVNRETWWAITDKAIKWVQWVLFIAVLQVAYDRTNKTSILVVEYILIFLVFRATLAFFQIAIRIDINGVPEKGAVYYLLSALITAPIFVLLYHFGWQFATDVFSALVDSQKTR